MLSQRLRTLVLKRIWELKLSPAEVVALTGISKELAASLALAN